MNVASRQGHGPLAICLLLAAVLHVAIVAGFDWPQPTARAPSRGIDILLQAAPMAAPAQVPEAPPVETPPAPANVAAAEAAARPVVAEPEPPAAASEPPTLAGRSALALAEEVAALHARQPRTPRSAERVARLDFASRASPEFAYYLEAWRRKVERIGNLNYPAQARAEGLSGSLRLLVVIGADGTLTRVAVLESSGKAVLDDAAVRIVELAAPFAPFSPRMAEAVDAIEIERTWRFLNNRYSS